MNQPTRQALLEARALAHKESLKYLLKEGLPEYYKHRGASSGEQLPKINIKEIQSVMDWLDFKEGNDPSVPKHVQAVYGAHIPAMSPYRLKILQENVPELQEVQEIPEFCGTACCVAGYVALQYVELEDLNDDGDIDFHVSKSFETPDGTVVENPQEDGYAEVDVAAQTILGLTDREASVLFDGMNTKEDIRTLFNVFLEERGEVVRV